MRGRSPGPARRGHAPRDGRATRGARARPGRRSSARRSRCRRRSPRPRRAVALAAAAQQPPRSRRPRRHAGRPRRRRPAATRPPWLRPRSARPRAATTCVTACRQRVRTGRTRTWGRAAFADVRGREQIRLDRGRDDRTVPLQQGRDREAGRTCRTAVGRRRRARGGPRREGGGRGVAQASAACCCGRAAVVSSPLPAQRAPLFAAPAQRDSVVRLRQARFVAGHEPQQRKPRDEHVGPGRCDREHRQRAVEGSGAGQLRAKRCGPCRRRVGR